MRLTLKNIGQIRTADLEFGDLTVFVGPQATGKSVALQFLKLVVDAGQVQEEFTRYGLDWSGKLPEFFDIYFGEGMRSIWKEQSAVAWNGEAFDVPGMVKRKRKQKSESLFLIPAQRVLTLRDGWPRPFTDYSPGDPFAVREFSEKLRTLVEKEFGADEKLFPQDRRLKREYRDLLQRSLFGKFALQVDKSRIQKRLVLESSAGKPLPYMVWSAGQREFVPLLLGLYWLLPPTKTPRRAKLEWVVLEELEMGLHPSAINTLLLLALELLSRGYRVCLSTHSPQVLEAVWALHHLRSCDASPSDVLAAFAAENTAAMQKVAAAALKKRLKVHYFSPEGVTHDISALDLEDSGEGDSRWGGLTDFSGRINDVVAAAIANAGR